MTNRRLLQPIGEEEETDIDVSWLDTSTCMDPTFKMFAIMQIWGMINSYLTYPAEVVRILMSSITEVCADIRLIDPVYARIMETIEKNKPSDAAYFNELFDTLYGSQDLEFRNTYDCIAGNPTEGLRRANTLQGPTTFFSRAAASLGLRPAVSVEPGIRQLQRFASVSDKKAEPVPITTTRAPMTKKEEKELRFLARPSDRFLRNFILRKWSIYQESNFGTLHFDAISRFILSDGIPSVTSAPQAASLARLPINIINEALFSGQLTVAQVSASIIGTRIITDAKLCQATGTECGIPVDAVDELANDLEIERLFKAAVAEHKIRVSKTIDQVRETRGKTPGGGKRLKRRSTRKKSRR